MTTSLANGLRRPIPVSALWHGSVQYTCIDAHKHGVCFSAQVEQWDEQVENGTFAGKI